MKFNKNLGRLKLKAGTIVRVYDMRLYLTKDIVVRGTKESIEYIKKHDKESYGA